MEIWIRADSGFARDAITGWCEANGVDYVLGLARKPRLQSALEGEMEQVRTEQAITGGAVRRYKDFSYRTLDSWDRERRVVGKVERLLGKDNPRFVVTSLGPERVDAARLYQQIYCARGDMENRIKEQQLGLFADRTSTATLRGNQLRLWKGYAPRPKGKGVPAIRRILTTLPANSPRRELRPFTASDFLRNPSVSRHPPPNRGLGEICALSALRPVSSEPQVAQRPPG